jgi:diguanylate cyclase (GGDEF)-like protein
MPLKLNEDQWLAIAGKTRRMTRFVAGCQSTAVHRLMDGRWIDIETGEPAEEAQAQRLSLCLREQQYYLYHPGAVVHVPLTAEGIEAVTSLQMVQAPTDSLAKALSELAAERARDALNAYGARYDNLVHLLNRDALQAEIVGALRGLLDKTLSLVPVSIDDPGPPDESPKRFDAMDAPWTVALFAMDIDKFKQINDTFGHIYGDNVLICVGRRLKDLCASFREEFAGRATFAAARPSGEEFFIVVQGHIEAGRLDSLARRVCERFSGDSLPNDTEVAMLAERDPAISRSLPKVVDRSVTISLGIAGLAAISPHERDHLEQIANDLKDKADAAMYRAKADGRNTWRHFHEIREKHGKVLEHRMEPEIVVVDIGSQVGVDVSQEYVVYHPEFTGDFMVTQKTDRSLRPLGRYPRIPSGRIVVTHVDKEIAFARPAPGHSRAVSQFVPGSLLHAVAGGGGDGALIDARAAAVARGDPLAAEEAEGGRDEPAALWDDEDIDAPTMSLSELSAWVASTVAQRPMMACAIRPIGLETIIKERGKAVVRQAVATLATAVREMFPGDTEVAVLRPSQVVFATAPLQPPAPGTNARDNTGDISRAGDISRLVAAVEAHTGEIVRFVAGWASGPRRVAKGGKDVAAGLDYSHLVDFAQCAVAAALSKGVKIKEFEDGDAAVVLTELRRDRRHALAVRAYYDFRSFGIRSAALETLAAQCAYEATPPNYDEAMSAIGRAVEMTPGNAGLHAFRGMIAVAAGDRTAAAESFDRATGLGYKPPTVMMPAYALACYYSYQQGHLKMARYDLYELLSKVSRQEVSPYLHIDRAAIHEALSDVGSPPRK